MQILSKDTMQWIEYSIFSPYPELVHGSFNRHGGLSKPPFDSLNASYAVGDKSSSVNENIQRITTRLKIPHLQLAKQVHGTEICHITSIQPRNTLPEVDALITNMPNLALGILHADCQAAIFFDPIKRVLAAVHAGWRGQSQMIYTKVIQELIRCYNCSVKDICISISPSLGPTNARFNLEIDPLSDIQKNCEVSEGLFNLWEAAKIELCRAGVLEKHIECANICTFKDPNWFSYRRSKATGRHLTVAMIQS